MSGKGSRPRPLSEPGTFGDRWAQTFGKAPLEDIGGMATADGHVAPAGTQGVSVYGIGGIDRKQ